MFVTACCRQSMPSQGTNHGEWTVRPDRSWTWRSTVCGSRTLSRHRHTRQPSRYVNINTFQASANGLIYKIFSKERLSVTGTSVCTWYWWLLNRPGVPEKVIWLTTYSVLRRAYHQKLNLFLKWLYIETCITIVNFEKNNVNLLLKHLWNFDWFTVQSSSRL